MQADVAALQHVTKTRTSAGVDDAAAKAYRDLFGHLDTLDVEDLAHVVVPAGTDKRQLELGFENLRELAARALLETERPQGDKLMAQKWQAAILDPALNRGSFVNSGSGFVLVHPQSGKAIAGTDGRTRVWTLQDVLDAAAGAPTITDRDIRSMLLE